VLKKSEARRNGGRVMSRFVTVAVSVLLLAGCVPIAANSQPLAWTVVGDEAVFRWCGDTSQLWNHIEITYATFVDGREDFTLAEGSGSFRLTHDEFTSTVPPEGATYSESSDLPARSGRVMLFFGVGISSEQMSGPRVLYDIDDIAKLDGMWLHPNGRLTEQPC
jgi:hypothetical protein